MTVEARSLAVISELADNPPANLKDVSFQSAQEPLVLYIARVPGTSGMTLQRRCHMAHCNG